jgi:DNA-binding response OmpR family regulator
MNAMPNILICDDDRDILSALKIYLANPDYVIFEAENGVDAVDIASREELHLILMDIMMPRMDGIAAMAKIREFSNVPIIMLTAKSEDSDKILGLDCGADDYITKPFNPSEVCARVRSALRRYIRLGSGEPGGETIIIGGLELDDAAKTVSVDGEEVSLTPKEYEVLRLLMRNPGKVFSPKEIYSLVWREKPLGSESTVAVHIRHIREKIEIDPSDPRYIKVIFGQGYKMEKVK